jgi:hypothetical protein
VPTVADLVARMMDEAERDIGALGRDVGAARI